LSTNNNTPNQPTLAKMATKSMAVARPGLLYGPCCGSQNQIFRAIAKM